MKLLPETPTFIRQAWMVYYDGSEGVPADFMKPTTVYDDEESAKKDCYRAAYQPRKVYIYSAPTVDGEQSFQERVKPWMLACFGEEISNDKLERGDRFLEESLELLQSGNYPKERIYALIDYVFNRPVGEPSQEVGGVMVTLAAYCLAHGLDMHEAGEVELARIWTKVEKIREKQKAKPTGSVLPVATVDGEPVAWQYLNYDEEEKAYCEIWQYCTEKDYNYILGCINEGKTKRKVRKLYTHAPDSATTHEIKIEKKAYALPAKVKGE